MTFYYNEYNLWELFVTLNKHVELFPSVDIKYSEIHVNCQDDLLPALKKLTEKHKLKK